MSEAVKELARRLSGLFYSQTESCETSLCGHCREFDDMIARVHNLVEPQEGAIVFTDKEKKIIEMSLITTSIKVEKDKAQAINNFQSFNNGAINSPQVADRTLKAIEQILEKLKQ